MSKERRGRGKNVRVRYLGKDYTFAELTELPIAALNGITASALWHRWKVAGRPEEVTAYIFRPKMGEKTARPPVERERPYNPNDRSPGWAERKYFPDAGCHGFDRL